MRKTLVSFITIIILIIISYFLSLFLLFVCVLILKLFQYYCQMKIQNVTKTSKKLFHFSIIGWASDLSFVGIPLSSFEEEEVKVEDFLILFSRWGWLGKNIKRILDFVWGWRFSWKL